ncbi:MAG TPA: DNA gyrase inhibitor YacG [Thiobacillus sp.]|nr:MAG: DNA gyrase inhibitor YacG [Hydrogenophilales bacterium 28-61-11]OYZ56272.1 MAG: DNA gyrase inhibitor YacG [Hydrogenophilales bacterium 16-61-112]OZA44922.1 MAG: DNA gyrase inhibitor YacG [Hydrogenophilales bacterium 17-61-76]HQT30538.1 DNA gyrase inhibitor YacG [Thiobacillus sp.]HQT70849.1 DNA gyrase inhibitor YacG [Thiobacillus sp.]
MKTPVVNCPTCNAQVNWTAENRWKPFCSERCKLIDLGQWAAEKYRVPAEEQEPESEETPPLAQ